MNWKTKYLVTLAFGVLAACLSIYFITTQCSVGPKAEKIPAESMGWMTLFSEPRRVLNPDAPHGHDNIGLMQFQFTTEQASVLTGFINAGSVAGIEMPDGRKGGNWKIGDKVYIVKVPSRALGQKGGFDTETYFAINFRKK